MNRTPEFTLSLIATGLLTLGWLIGAFFTFCVGLAPVYDDSGYAFFGYMVLYSIASIPLLVLIWFATFKVKNNSRGWGIFILVMGALYTLSIYFVPGILLLIAGIMMVSKKNDKIESNNDSISM
jgi:hypothetical protein